MQRLAFTHAQHWAYRTAVDRNNTHQLSPSAVAHFPILRAKEIAALIWNYPPLSKNPRQQAPAVPTVRVSRPGVRSCCCRCAICPLTRVNERFAAYLSPKRDEARSGRDGSQLSEWPDVLRGWCRFVLFPFWLVSVFSAIISSPDIILYGWLGSKHQLTN